MGKKAGTWPDIMLFGLVDFLWKHNHMIKGFWNLSHGVYMVLYDGCIYRVSVLNGCQSILHCMGVTQSQGQSNYAELS